MPISCNRPSLPNAPSQAVATNGKGTNAVIAVRPIKNRLPQRSVRKIKNAKAMPSGKAIASVKATSSSVVFAKLAGLASLSHPGDELGAINLDSPLGKSPGAKTSRTVAAIGRPKTANNTPRQIKSIVADRIENVFMGIGFAVSRVARDRLSVAPST